MYFTVNKLRNFTGLGSFLAQNIPIPKLLSMRRRDNISIANTILLCIVSTFRTLARFVC